MAFNLYDPNTPRMKKPVPKSTVDFIKKILVIAASVAVATTAVTLAIVLWPSSPSLVIKLGMPSDVKLDGTNIGSGTEIVVEDIEPGRHTIEAIPKDKIPFLEKDVQKVDIASSKKEIIEMINVTEISFESEPLQATIILSSIDGDLKLGKTPLKTKLPYGQYEVVMRLPGFPEYSKSFLSSGAESIIISSDFNKLALEQPGSKKLSNNLIVSSLRAGAFLTVDGNDYPSGTKAFLESGFHNVCIGYGSTQVICTQVMFPSVGKPVEISWPESISYPCMYFGKDLFILPNDARNVSVSQDGSSLVYATGFSDIDCVDLITGQKTWSEKIDRAYDQRPVIMYGTDANYVYGVAGVPSDVRTTSFCVELKSGNELDVCQKYSGSVLPLASQGYKAGDWTCYANVWSENTYGQRNVSAIEAVTVKNLETQRFIRQLESNESASFLGVSTSATKDRHPLFVFSYRKGSGSSILILDPSVAVPWKQVEYKEWNKEKFTQILEKPKTEDLDKGWMVISTSINPVGVCYDGGFDTGNAIVIYSDYTVASISYPEGKLKWSRYVDKDRNTEPIISQAKGKNVVILSFPTSPYEYRLDLKTGEQIERRVKPLTPEEAVNGQACPGGSFVLPDNTAISGLKMDSEGKFKATWKRSFKTGLLLSSPWGPVHIEKDKVEILGSHMLSPISSFILPGLGSPGSGKIFGDKRYLAIYTGSRFWIIDREGSIRGYFTGINRLDPLESSGHKALLAQINREKVVIPWPKN
jgi:hypothetical protein